MSDQLLSEKVKQLRIKNGFSQEYLAEESKVSLRTIQRIEKNESKPTGETIKRLAMAFDISVSELTQFDRSEEYINLSSSLLLLKKLKSQTDNKSELKVFDEFIDVLQALKEKDLSDKFKQAIDEYLAYLELEKVPSFSQEMFKPKLKKFKKFLRSKLNFVPKRYYFKMGTAFIVSFVIGFLATKGIGMGLILFAILFTLVCYGVDYRMEKQGRSLRF